MSVRALRRLSETELSGLLIGLDAIGKTEAYLVQRLDRMRRASVKESKVRAQLGLNGPGEFMLAFQTVLEVVRCLTLAREETTNVVTTGRIEKGRDDD